MSDMKTNKGKQVLEKSDKSKLTEIQLRWLGMFSKTVSEKGNETNEETIPEEFKKLETTKKIEIDKERLGDLAKNDDAEAGYQAVLKDVGPRLATALKAVGKKSNQMVEVMVKLHSEAKEHAVKKEFKEASDKLIEANSVALEVLGGTVGHQDISTGDRKKLVEAKRGDKYKDEGFFVGTGQDEGGGQHHAGKDTRTRMYDDKLREQAAVYKDEEGNLVDKSGKKLTTVPKGGYLGTPGSVGEGYVTDPQTGEVYKFEEDKSTSGVKKMVDHHSSPVGGKDVVSAGMDKIEDGIVRKVTGESGHYTPKPENVYQQVRGYEDQGVKMRSEKLTMLDKDGNRKDVNADIAEKWRKVQHSPGRPKDGQDPKNVNMLTINDDDLDDIKELKKELQDLGVGLDYVDAKAEVFRPTSFLSDEEKSKLSGLDGQITVGTGSVTGADVVAGQVVDQVIGKLGWDKKWPTQKYSGVDPPKNKIELTAKLTKEITTAKTADPTKKVADIINGYIGLMMRVRWDNPDVTRLTQDTSAFGQTGGNIEAIDAKSKLMEELKSRVKETAPEGGDLTAQLGKLLKLSEPFESSEVQKKLNEVLVSKYGITNPGNLTQEDAYVILAKGRVPLELQIKDLGGEPELIRLFTQAGVPQKLISGLTLSDQVELLKNGTFTDAKWFELLGGEEQVKKQLEALVPNVWDSSGPWGEYGPADADWSKLSLQQRLQIVKATDYSQIEALVKTIKEKAGAGDDIISSVPKKPKTPVPPPKPSKTSKVDIGKVKEEDKLTEDQLTQEDKLYRELGGDEAILEIRLPAWKETHKNDLARILELQKSIPKAKDDKPLLEEELKKLLKVVKEDDPMPTLVSIGKERKQKGVANLIPELQ